MNLVAPANVEDPGAAVNVEDAEVAVNVNEYWCTYCGNIYLYIPILPILPTYTSISK